MLNNVCLQGRLAKDPEIRTTATGKSYARITIANNSSYKDDNGNYKTNFINCVAWGKTAEFIDRYFKKGQEILISGEIATGSYDRQDGTKQYTTEVFVQQVNFCGSKAEKSESQPTAQTQGNSFDITEEDLPFSQLM